MEAQRAVWREMGPVGRLRLALQMSDEARAFTLAGLAARHPGLNARSLQHLLADRLYAAVGHESPT
jgi:hypothetical protein